MLRSKKQKWSKDVTFWYPLTEKRKKRGRQKIRWEDDDIKREAGTKWRRKTSYRELWQTAGKAFAKGQADTNDSAVDGNKTKKCLNIYITNTNIRRISVGRYKIYRLFCKCFF